MRGFLDPDYPTRVPTDYRSVIDAFDAGLAPARVFGFGNNVRAEARAGLGVLGNRDFYTDGNTELGEVIDQISADTGLSATHIVVGDGRRSSPDNANGQFVSMRALADRWTAHGGTFMVAASRAPFRPVQDDPSACGSDASARAGRVCPLYAFAFVAPGEATRVAGVLSRAFEHLFVAPLPAVPGAAVVASAEGQGGPTLDRGWSRAADGTPIVRVRADTASNQAAHVRITLKDTASAGGAASLASLRGEGLQARIFVRPMGEGADGRDWTPSPARGALVRSTADPLVFDFLSLGAESPRYLYRVELHPTGVPPWLGDFDAENAADQLRTFGLGRLFERFRSTVPQSGSAALRLYAVVN